MNNRYFLAACILIVISTLSGVWLEKYMSLHMLVHIPMLFCIGILLAQSFNNNTFFLNTRVLLKKLNEQGVPGLLFFSLVGAFWMIPKALDSVLLSNWFLFAKYISCITAGVLLYFGWLRSHIVVRVFFTGMFCWMLAIAGMLYIDSPSRLCNFYLLDDQVWAGRGLVILAILLPSIWFAFEFKARNRISS